MEGESDRVWKTRCIDFVLSSAVADLSLTKQNSNVSVHPKSLFAHIISALGSVAAAATVSSYGKSLCPSADNLLGGVHLNLSHLLPHYQNKIN